MKGKCAGFISGKHRVRMCPFFFAQQIPWWNIWYICHSCDWDDWLRYLRFREAIRNLALFGPTPSLFFNPDSSGSWTKKKVRTHPVEVFRYSLGECISMETNMAMENQSFTSFYLYIFIIIHIYIYRYSISTINRSIDFNIYNYLHISHSIPIGTLIFPQISIAATPLPGEASQWILQNWDLADFTTCINATQLESCMHRYIYILCITIINYIYI